MHSHWYLDVSPTIFFTREMLVLQPRIGRTCCFLGLKDIILTPKNAGVKVVDVERLHALPVGVTRVDRYLIEER